MLKTGRTTPPAALMPRSLPRRNSVCGGSSTETAEPETAAEETEETAEETAAEPAPLADLIALLKDELMLTLNAGSSLTCRMAEGFSFLPEAETLSLQIGSYTYSAEEQDIAYGESYVYTFGDEFKLTYYGPERTDEPYFVLVMNREKAAGESLTLRFQVHLDELAAPAEAGVTYVGTYDRYGLSSWEGIDVFGRTCLNIKDRFGNDKGNEYFTSPTVSYTALKLEGQYGSTETHYYTADQVGETFSYEIDDETFTVNLISDGFHTIPVVE